jgi:hypothetical protein
MTDKNMFDRGATFPGVKRPVPLQRPNCKAKCKSKTVGGNERLTDDDPPPELSFLFAAGFLVITDCSLRKKHKINCSGILLLLANLYFFNLYLLGLAYTTPKTVLTMLPI